MEFMEPGVNRPVRLEIDAPKILYPDEPDSDVMNVRPRDNPPSDADLCYLIESCGLEPLFNGLPKNGRVPKALHSNETGLRPAEVELAKSYMTIVKELMFNAIQLGSIGEIRMTMEHPSPNTDEAGPIILARDYARTALAACGIRVYWATLGEKHNQYDELEITWPQSLNVG